MKQQIKCPHCQKLFPIEESLKHETEELRKKLKKEEEAQQALFLFSHTSGRCGREKGGVLLPSGNDTRPSALTSFSVGKSAPLWSRAVTVSRRFAV